MAAKIRRNDEVIVLAGKDKGKKGKVTKILSTGKVLVEGINMVKKHQKPVPQLGQQGGIVEQEAAIDVSNIAVFNADTGRHYRRFWVPSTGSLESSTVSHYFPTACAFSCSCSDR